MAIQSEASKESERCNDQSKSTGVATADPWREKNDRRRVKIRKEKRWWESQSPVFRLKYGDQYVAIHEEQVVDSDINLSDLSKRIRDRFGSIAVAITLASRPPNFTIHI